ncbi:hypothetical protein ACHAQA_004784, partial [Verticillium albo-atrum]
PRKIAFFDCSLLALKTWYYALPPGLKVERMGPNNNYPQAYVLGMIYHTSVILLAKPFLKPDPNARRSQYDVSLSQTWDSEREAMCIKAATLCKESAREICVLGAKYREVFGSFRKCPPTANHCILQAALVTIHTHAWADDNAKQSGKMSLENYLKTLKELSQSWSPPKRYWSSVTRLVEAQQITVQDASSTHPPTLKSEEVGNTTVSKETMAKKSGGDAAPWPSISDGEAGTMPDWMDTFYHDVGFGAYWNTSADHEYDDLSATHQMYTDLLQESAQGSHPPDFTKETPH